jgi:hypothetical protein
MSRSPSRLPFHSYVTETRGMGVVSGRTGQSAVRAAANKLIISYGHSRLWWLLLIPLPPQGHQTAGLAGR